VLCVTRKKLWVIAGFVGASAIGAVPAITAAAYPPGKQLGATATYDGNGTITVTIANAQKDCTYIVQSRGLKESGTATGATTVVTLPVTKTGNYPIQVRSFGCPGGGPTETANINLGVTTFKASGPTSAKTGKTFKVSASGWSQDADVVFALTDSKGKTVTSKKVTPNEDGDASYTFTAPATAGAYVVTVVQSGSPSQSFNVSVTSDKVPQKAPKPKPKPKPKPVPKPKPKPVPKPTPKPKPKSH
jgi:hypothetical protein